MKPPIVPLTEDDALIWLRVQLRARVVPLQLPARTADRRDAALMSWLTGLARRYYEHGTPLPKAAQLPLAHLWVRIDPDWPAGHYLIDLT